MNLFREVSNFHKTGQNLIVFNQIKITHIFLNNETVFEQAYQYYIIYIWSPWEIIKFYLGDDLSSTSHKGSGKLEFEFFIFKPGAAFCMFCCSVWVRVTKVDIILLSR